MQRPTHRQVNILLIVASVFIVVLSGIALRNWYLKRTTKASPSVSSLNPPAPSPTVSLNPLQIEAIKARSYPGSALTIEQNLGNQGGYTNQIVSYLSDGLKIYALMSTPNGNAPNGGWPVIILNHGYINPAEYRTNDGSYGGLTATLARSGFVIIKPDYRGHGQSQGTPEGGHFSPVYTYDDLNLIATIKQTALFNPARIGTLGHSLGAHTSLRVAVVSADIKATVYLSGVVGSIEDILYNWPRSPMPSDLPASVQTTREQLLSQYGTPKTNPEFWNSVSAIQYVANITGKTQINQSENDSTVPKLFSDHLNAALLAANKPVEYYTYPGDDHQFRTNATLAYQRILSFYRANL